MIVKVGLHKLELVKSPVNEKEINITKVKFEFPEEMDGFVKEAYFTKGDTYKIVLSNDECDIPSEVLAEQGDIELGVVAYKVVDETITRYNPSPVYFNSWIGSLKEEYENTEVITPTDKEQIEQELENINLSITKEGNIATITFTNKDGTTQTETLEDGEDGKSIEYNWSGTSLGIRQEGQSQYEYVNLKGDKGDAGSIKIIVVQTLPTEDIDTSAIYLVPSQTTATQNNYEEYVYINNQWEKLGEVPIETDLSDYYTKEEVNNLIPDLTGYVKNTDYASQGIAGVIKTNSNYAIETNSGNGNVQAQVKDYATYSSGSNSMFISKGTLENVITGKGLTTKSYVDGLVGDIATALDTINGEVI